MDFFFLAQIVLNTIVLLPPLQGVIQVDLVPFGMAILFQPLKVVRNHFCELTDIVTMSRPEIIRNKNGLDCDGGDFFRLKGICVLRYLGRRIKFGDALV